MGCSSVWILLEAFAFAAILKDLGLLIEGRAVYRQVLFCSVPGQKAVSCGCGSLGIGDFTVPWSDSFLSSVSIKAATASFSLVHKNGKHPKVSV